MEEEEFGARAGVEEGDVGGVEGVYEAEVPVLWLSAQINHTLYRKCLCEV